MRCSTNFFEDVKIHKHIQDLTRFQIDLISMTLNYINILFQALIVGTIGKQDSKTGNY